MGVADQIRALEKAIADLNRRMNDKLTLGNFPSHHATHEQGGADAIKLDDLATPDNNADLNASIASHGLLKILPNDATKYMDGSGLWSVPGGGGGGADVYYHPDRFPASPTAQSDHFDDAAIDPKWVNFNVGASLTKSESEHLLRLVKTSEAADLIRGIYQVLPAGDFTLTAKLTFPGIGGGALTPKIAIALYEDATNNPLTCDIYTWGFYLIATHNLNLICQYYTAYNVYNTNDYNAAPFAHMSAIYFRIRQSTTTWYFDYSLDNLVWKNVYSRARRFTPAEFGFCCGNNSGATETFWIDWIYYEATANMVPPVGRSG